MILTPKQLHDRKGEFTVVDVRSEKQINEFPMDGLKTINSNGGSISDMKGSKVLVCQFGIVTEGMIIENELDDTFSLLGGAQAWIEFQSKKEDLSRWSRQTILPEVGMDGQKKLLNATVAIVGMGGLGCPAAQSLITAGVGKLILIDGDIVELSNLHRQPLYGADDLNRLKVEVAKERLEQLNNKAVIVPIDKYLNEENGMSFIQDANVIIDATDNIQARQLIDKFSKEANIPMVYGGLFRYEGQVAVLNVNGSPGYCELFPEPPSGGDTCADAGVLGMLPGIIGNIQAFEAVKFIVGITPNLVGKLLVYDGMSHITQTIEL
ncbi:MAG: HesA/MoeB/ThiF family protein [Candidatus Marinimicrobia bacterium]|jgi:sulfur-carrier protein adenylyltransferase/sulfurtransferase|nr:HesA/MoeB/ThiF family protein [Candidatus Neomarinimicrobiota bacterium]MBT3849149.1 HesA/MoeB/ThiF family protein [Candidatus Neomarinimicrobiota bacterium]MBT4053608.1 HesA/MoeB/ThiF family protein [Candidatus Neomarinimicrobiota bacterium]MBT4370343.1 HesA/MoeB/ThiF family protein [Candidatus Neomarinimicrobiota bacterium]MBT4661334.1 HesA/MoeB/ThiF family protein [Candidatus Neomarinimicrobiota bacterium]